MIGVSMFIGFFLGIIGVILIGIIHGFMIALIAWSWNSAVSSTRFPLWLWPLLTAAMWTSLDWLRCTSPLAHSWGALAYTQWRDVALLQTASFAGQHGLTFVCIWCAASLALWLRTAAQRKSAILWRAPLFVLLVLHGWGAWRLHQADERPHQARQLRVLLVQTTASGSNGQDAFAQAYELTARAARQNHYDLVVWPETTFLVARQFTTKEKASDAASSDTADAIEYSMGRDLGGLQAFQANELSRTLGTPILSGAAVPIANGARSNEALLFDGSEQVQSRAKNHLVPFGERAPWSETLPFLRALAPSPEVQAGSGTKPLWIAQREIGRTAVGSLICFESCFEEPSRGLQQHGARVLFVLTNDDWSSGTESPWQHAAMSAVRAVENGVPVAQVANGGYTFAVDRWGRFVVKSTFNAPQTLEATLFVN